MTALQEALKSLGPIDYPSLPIEDLKSYLSDSFHHAQLLIDSLPSPPSDGEIITPSSAQRGRSFTTSSSTASSASEMSVSSARSDPPPAEVGALQQEWGKPLKLSAKDNPLGMAVYKASGKDGKGTWFARRSVHEGLGFSKWKKSLQREFPETLKVQGSPGEGNIRGIGGERRVEQYEVENVGKLEVYHLSAQFPGPTTPRDFVEMIMTSDTALSQWSKEDPVEDSSNTEIPRHFMVISKPCVHPECPPRDGFVRGQYESVEFIREVPLIKPPKKSASAIHLPLKKTRERSGSSALSREAILRNAQHASELDAGFEGSRPRGKTISFAESRGVEAKGESFDVPRDQGGDCESNPVEWIMITRSDPGGGIPRFLVERGTPSSIVADASKFLNWACSNDLEDMEGDDNISEPGSPKTDQGEYNIPRRSTDLYDYETNGHLAGIGDNKESTTTQPDTASNQSGVYDAISNTVGAASAAIATYAPTMITNHLPVLGSSEKIDGSSGAGTLRRASVQSAKSSRTVETFVSALEGTEDDSSDALSTGTGASNLPSIYKGDERQEKELQKLEEKKQQLNEKLAKAREKELSKKVGDADKDQTALAKAEEKHKKEVAKQEEKFRKEVERLEAKKRRDALKAEEKRKKIDEKDEKTRMQHALDGLKAEVDLLKIEKEILSRQVGQLQQQNTTLTTKIGRLGPVGEEILRDVREELKEGTGRARGSSIFSSKPASEKSKDNVVI